VFNRIWQRAIAAVIVLGAVASSAYAQNQPPMDTSMPMGMPMDTPGWHVMQDAVVFGMFNHQGGPRGGDEFKAPNWWMGMFSRKVGSSQLTFNTMLSLDPATVGEGGYREIFQTGEAINGKPLIDHQHPHDFFMQLAGVWRIPVTEKTGFTIAGGPVGEPALGPVAFMHRASAAENPMVPLSHHTFDSTHISFGVVTAAVDHGPWLVEGSLFNGREPDQYRWDFDFGALDSYSGRVWYRPTDEWEFQVSSGHLKHPEELESGNITRTTTSVGWLKKYGDNFSAITIGYGYNRKDAGSQNSAFAESTRHFGANSIYGRFEAHQAESAVLATGATPDQLLASGITLPRTCPSVVHCISLENLLQVDAVLALTVGGLRDVLNWHGFEGGFGGAVTVYGVPDALKETHGHHPVSFQLFFRLRPPVGSTGRMWNMRMSQPMKPMADMPHQMD
jgi:hypothetical protein